MITYQITYVTFDGLENTIFIEANNEDDMLEVFRRLYRGEILNIRYF